MPAKEKKPATRGARAKKEKAGKAARRGKGNARNNPKAFKAASGPTAMRLNAYRAMEKQEKKYHVSLVDRCFEKEEGGRCKPGATKRFVEAQGVGPEGTQGGKLLGSRGKKPCLASHGFR